MIVSEPFGNITSFTFVVGEKTVHVTEGPTSVSMSTTATTDGSAASDAPIVEISRSGPERYRYRCPNGHVDWDRTNLHVWCRGCLRQAENGDDIDPEHWEIYDAKLDEPIPWSRVQVVE